MFLTVTVAVMLSPFLLPGGGLFKARIREAVAEGIDDRLVVVDKALLCRRFVVAVAEVDALFVLGGEGGGDVVVAHGDVALADVAVLVDGGGVHEGGIFGEVCRPDVDGVAGGVDLAGEDVAQRVKAGRTGAAYPKDGVYARVCLQFAQLHDVGRVDDDDGLVVIVFTEFQPVLFVGAQLQWCCPGTYVSYSAFAVPLLTASAKAALSLASRIRSDERSQPSPPAREIT